MPKKARKPLPKRYKAAPGSAREKMIRKAGKLYREGKVKQAAELRERMEKKVRDAKKKKTTTQ